jgi:hypothetical protein
MAEYRLASGTLTAAALAANSNYLLSNFPIQSDQISSQVNPWESLTDDGTTYPRRARYVTLGNMRQRGDGFWQFQWVWDYITEGMAAYLYGAFFGIYDSGLVTVKTRLETGSFQTYNCTMLYPVPDENFQHGYLGLEKFTLRFVGGIVAA